MNEVITLPHPEAKIVRRHRGMVCVYGWTKERVTEHGRIPLSGLVGIYAFTWTARLAMLRWLRKACKTHPDFPQEQQP